MYKNDLFRKKVQGQPKVIIFSISIWPMPLMLHTKPQGHWHFGFGKEYFKVFFLLYMGMATILVL